MGSMGLGAKIEAAAQGLFSHMGQEYHGPLIDPTKQEGLDDDVFVAGLSAGAIADTGSLVKMSNMDRIFVLGSGKGFGVLDGLGGPGGFFSQDAVKLLLPVVKRIAAGELAENLLREVSSEMSDINDAYRQIFESPPTADTGTTATIGAISTLGNGERQLVVAHIGDSRAYRLREGELVCLTTDDADERGMIKYLGRKSNKGEFNIQTHNIQNGDVYLFCTDGVSSQVGREKIRDILSLPKPPGEKAEHLVRRGLMGGDDASAVVVHF